MNPARTEFSQALTAGRLPFQSTAPSIEAMSTASAGVARSGAVFVSDTRERCMTNRQYVPPKVWTWSADSDDPFASMNRPEAGPRYERELPVGKHPLRSEEHTSELQSRGHLVCR